MRYASRISSIKVGMHLGRSFLMNRLRLPCVVDSSSDIGRNGDHPSVSLLSLKSHSSSLVGRKNKTTDAGWAETAGRASVLGRNIRRGKENGKVRVLFCISCDVRTTQAAFGTQRSSCYDHGLWSQLLTKPHSHLQSSPSHLPGWRARAGAGLR